MKKIALNPTLVICFMAIIFGFNYGYCGDFSDFNEQRLITDPFKSWVIKFNRPYDHKHIMEMSEKYLSSIVIHPIGETHNYIPVELVQKSDTQLEVIPLHAYDSNKEYVLHLNNHYIRDLKGNRLKEQISLPFKLINSQLPVQFEDGVLEDMVRELIGKNSGPIYQEDLGGITHLLGRSNKGQIHSLEGIQYLYNLEYLDIMDERVRDISPLYNLKKLNSLRINSEYLRDHKQIKELPYLTSLSISKVSSQDMLHALSELTNLRELSIVASDIHDYSFLYPLQNLNSLFLSTGIKNISFVENLPNLEYLGLSSNYIEDLTPISSLSKLRELDLTNNKIKDLSPLNKLTNLTRLDADYNFIENIHGIENCIKLERISFIENNIKDISPLGNLYKLTHLDLRRNIISDISALKNLQNVKNLGLYGNPITDITPAVEISTYPDELLSWNKIQEAGLKAKQIIEEIIDDNMTDFEKEDAIYRYLIDNIEYDMQYYIYGIETAKDPEDIYGALVHGWAICDGYAHAMKVLGRLAGLDCIYIDGSVINSEYHAWNMINLDGHYYHLDATWDDGGNNLPTDHSFFNISDTDMMDKGLRVWSREHYPKTKELDTRYTRYCEDNNISTDNFHLISGTIYTNESPKANLFVRLNLTVLDKYNNVKYSTFDYFMLPARSKKVDYQIKIPGDSNFAYYTMDYELFYEEDELDFLNKGYCTRNQTSSYEYMQDIFELNESIDVYLINFSSHDPYSNDYKLSYFPVLAQELPNPYLINNVRDVTLPPYSAVLYSIGYHNYDLMDYNSHGLGDILVYNNSGENKLFKAGEIARIAVAVQDEMTIYYSIFIFEGSFDEEELRIRGSMEMDNVLYSGKWIYGGKVPNMKDDVGLPPQEGL